MEVSDEALLAAQHAFRLEHSVRIKAGLKKALENGRKGGRPKRSDVSPSQVREQWASGLTIRQIAQQCECGVGTVYRALHLALASDEVLNIEKKLYLNRRDVAWLRTARQRLKETRAILKHQNQ